MNSGSKSAQATLQDCLNLLNEALKIVMKDSKKYYLKRESEVTKKVMNEVSTSIVAVSTLLYQFISCWIGSKKSGADAILNSSKLSDRIDIKLIQSGKMDFDQLGKIMMRMNRADDALLGLNRIAFYVNYYRNLCSEKILNRQAENADIFIHGLLSRAIDMVKGDAERCKNQIERCNLYFRSATASKAFKVAIISLLVSSFAVLLTILNIFLPHILNLLAGC